MKFSDTFNKFVIIDLYLCMRSVNTALMNNISLTTAIFLKHCDFFFRNGLFKTE